jgi:hypothetical protein
VGGVVRMGGQVNGHGAWELEKQWDGVVGYTAVLSPRGRHAGSIEMHNAVRLSTCNPSPAHSTV